MRDLSNLNKEHGEKRTKRISDTEVYDAIEAVKKDEEGSVAKALVALLAVTVDTRAFLRKLYKNVVVSEKDNEKK